MPRAFLYLYFIIVFSVILVGWGLDQVWKLYVADDATASYETQFYQTLELSIKNITENNPEGSEQRRDSLQRFLADANSSLDTDVALISINDIAGSSVVNDIEKGQLVTIFEENGDQIVYKRVGQTDSILQVHTLASNTVVSARVYHIFIIVFYSLIALVVFFWLWPLTRDLKQMENATRSKSEDGLPVEVTLPYRSPIYPLAIAYNQSTEKIRDLIASHEDMSYAMSHELRTPLARMKFGLEILYDDLKNSLISNALGEKTLPQSQEDSLKYKKNQESILESVDGLRGDVVQMDSLISELLNYASFERSSSISLKAGDLLAFVEHHVNIFREENCLELERSSTNKQIEFSIRSELSVSHVVCDWNLIERAFLNVIINATRYTSSQILIELHSDSLSTSIAISDDGPGIADEDQDRIFGSFVRLRKNREDAGTGFGLGLSIVHRVMHWHKGSVTASRSTLGGARFVLEWPVQKNVTQS